MTGCSFIGAPFDGAASLGRPGARYAPDAIRRHLSWMSMRTESAQVYWIDYDRLVNVPVPLLHDAGDAAVVPHDVEATIRAVRDLTRREAQAHRTPIVVGGDDSLLYPAVAGARDALGGTWAVVHFDAHLDLLDQSVTQGSFSHSSGMRRALELDGVDPGLSVQVGTRNLNYPASKRFITETGLAEIPARTVHERGWSDALEAILDRVAGADHVFLALDADVLDPAHAPGVGWQEPGGLTSRQLLDLVVGLAGSTDAMCLNEVNPLTDSREQTVIVAANVIYQFALAKTAAGTE